MWNWISDSMLALHSLNDFNIVHHSAKLFAMCRHSVFRWIHWPTARRPCSPKKFFHLMAFGAELVWSFCCCVWNQADKRNYQAWCNQWMKLGYLLLCSWQRPVPSCTYRRRRDSWGGWWLVACSSNDGHQTALLLNHWALPPSKVT